MAVTIDLIPAEIVTIKVNYLILLTAFCLQFIILISLVSLRINILFLSVISLRSYILNHGYIHLDCVCEIGNLECLAVVVSYLSRILRYFTVSTEINRETRQWSINGGGVSSRCNFVGEFGHIYPHLNPKLELARLVSTGSFECTSKHLLMAL